MPFITDLAAAWQKNNSLLCVGLDPDLSKFPAHLQGKPDAIYEFCKAIVDATADVACSFKPQIAYFAGESAEAQLEALIDYIHAEYPDIPVILDAKRGDIGATAAQYAREAFVRYQADALTVNPYMGFDSVEPYLEYPDCGLIVLCRTSNPGGSDLQKPHRRRRKEALPARRRPRRREVEQARPSRAGRRRHLPAGAG